MITLCLYNTYDKKRLHAIHERSIARAAPVCVACDFSLALVDFPEQMFETVESSTTIGDFGRFLKLLKEKDRYHELQKRFPLGILVATTSHPDREKSIATLPLKRLALKKDIVLVMGLGRRGLPKKIRKKAHHHWDATGKGMPLETCTAMGFLGGVLLEMKGNR